MQQSIEALIKIELNFRYYAIFHFSVNMNTIFGKWRGLTPRQNSSELRRIVPAVASGWRRCARFDKPENQIHDFPR